MAKALEETVLVGKMHKFDRATLSYSSARELDNRSHDCVFEDDKSGDIIQITYGALYPHDLWDALSDRIGLNKTKVRVKISGPLVEGKIAYEGIPPIRIIEEEQKKRK